jgi:uncharacterized Tic20 family protein
VRGAEGLALGQKEILLDSTPLTLQDQKAMETPQIDPPPSPSPNPNPVPISDRQWAIGAHLTPFLAFGPHGGNIIGPLIIWLIKKQDSAYLDAVGKRVLNFQISYALYVYAALFVSAVLHWTIIVPMLEVFGIAVLYLAWLIFTILGAIKESNGEPYQAPLVIKFFS